MLVDHSFFDLHVSHSTSLMGNSSPCAVQYTVLETGSEMASLLAQHGSRGEMILKHKFKVKIKNTFETKCFVAPCAASEVVSRYYSC